MLVSLLIAPTAITMLLLVNNSLPKSIIKLSATENDIPTAILVIGECTSCKYPPTVKISISPNPMKIPANIADTRYLSLL